QGLEPRHRIGGGAPLPRRRGRRLPDRARGASGSAAVRGAEGPPRGDRRQDAGDARDRPRHADRHHVPLNEPRVRSDEEQRPGLFPPTQWTLVLAARDRPEERRRALELLVAPRWKALYV